MDQLLRLGVDGIISDRPDLLLEAVQAFDADGDGEPGDLLGGRAFSAEEIASLDPERWPLRFFEPESGQVAAALGLIALGFGATFVIDRIGRRLERRDGSHAPSGKSDFR